MAAVDLLTLPLEVDDVVDLERLRRVCTLLLQSAAAAEDDEDDE